MEIEIIKSGTGAAEIIANGNKMLAVSTNLNSKIYKQISRQELLSRPGILIKNGISKEWVCTESFVYKEGLFFPGSFYEGNTIADINLDIGLLLDLAVSFQTIIKADIPISGFYTPGIFKTEREGILYFPPALINFITSQLSESNSISFWQPYNHPDAVGKSQYSFTLGVLAYQLLTKELPYTGTSITEIREKMRSSKPVEVELLKPGIQKSIADLIDNALALKDINLSEWIEQLKLWEKDGISTISDKTARFRIKETAARKQNNRQKKFKRKQFLTHNWKTIAATAAAIAFIISFSIGPIKNAMEPPITAGMSAKEVVGTFYSAIIDMNTEIMEDCVKKGIAKNDINEVTQLFVISRVRSGYEGTSGLVTAQDWNDGIIKTLNSGEQIFGIADLVITKLINNTYTADYIKWYPNIPDNPESNEILPPLKVLVQDTITLEKVKDVWIIVNLERNTKELK